MSQMKSALILFVSIFVLYALYVWFVMENHDISKLLLESLFFSGLITVISTSLDILRNKFTKNK